MKSIYILSILSLLLFPGCSKDFFKKYDKRIIGIWNVTDIERNGIGGNTSSLVFKEGTFTFRDDGTLTYVNSANVTYQGNWDIDKKTIDDQTLRSLQLTVVDYTTRQVLTEYYDDMDFSGSNHFKTRIYAGLHTYVTHFKR